MNWDHLDHRFARPEQESLPQFETRAWLAAEKKAFEAAMNDAPLAVSLAILLQAVVDQAQDGRRYAFYIVDSQTGTLRHVVGMPGSSPETQEAFGLSPEARACGLAVAKGEPVVMPDVLAEPRGEDWKWFAQDQDYRGCWSFPVETSAGKLVGSFAFYFDGPRDAQPEDYELAAAITQCAAIIISRHQENEERQRVEVALRASETKYRSLFESLDTGYCVLEIIFDDDGKPVDYLFLEVNPAFAAHTGLGDPTGKHVHAILRSNEQFWCDTYGRVALTGQRERFEHRAGALGRWYSVDAFRIGTPEQHRVAVLFCDINDRKLREEQVILIDRIGHDLARLSDPDEIMKTVGRHLGLVLDLSSCTLLDVDESGDEVTVRHAWVQDGNQGIDRSRTFRPRDYLTDDFKRISRDGESFVVRDTALDTRLNRNAFAELGIGAFVLIPYLKGGRWTGYLAVAAPAPRDWRDDEIALLKQVSERLFARIEQARAAEMLRMSGEQLQLVLQSMTDAVYVGDASGIILANQAALDQLGYSTREELNRNIVTLAEEIQTRDYASGLIIPLEQQAFFRALHGEHVVQDVIITHRKTNAERVVRCAASPLTADGRIVGAVAVNSDITDRKRHIEALHASEEKSDFLLSLGDAMRQTNDADETIRIASQMLGEKLKASRIVFAEIDEVAGVAHLRQGWTAEGTETHPATVNLADFAGPLLDDLRAGRTLRYDDIGAAPYARKDMAALAKLGIHAGLSVPLLIDGRFVVNLNVDQVHQRAWTDAEVAIVEEVAERLWSALGRIGAEEKLRKSEARLQTLVAELQHRVRNILAVVRSVFRRTVTTTDDLDDLAMHFTGRLDALARTQVIVTRTPGGEVDLESMIRDELLSVGASDGPNLRIEGPDVALPSRVAESLAMVIHELTTNALKYGALKTAGARLDIRWENNMDYRGSNFLHLIWHEQGVPTVPVKPVREGFGRELIEEALPYRLGAETKLEFLGGGIRCSISFPLPE